MSDPVQPAAASGTTTAQPSPEPSFNPWDDTAPAGEAGTSAAPAGEAEGAGTAIVPATVPAGAAPVPVTPGLSAETISDLVAKTVGATIANQPKPAPVVQPFTEEDFIRTFQVFQPTPELLAEIGLPNTPQTVAAFQAKIVTPIVRQAVTMAAYQLEKVKQELTEHVKTQLQQYEPARQMAVERYEEAAKGRFFEKYQDLKGYEPILMEIKDRLVSQGTRFKDEDEAFKAIADHAKTIIGKIGGLGNGNGGQTATNGQQTTTVSRTGGMSTLSGGGQGGSGAARTTGGGKKKNTSEALWG